MILRYIPFRVDKQARSPTAGIIIVVIRYYSGLIFLIRIVGGDGVQLGPFGTATTNRLIVPAPGDCDNEEIGGMMIGRGK
jgi:hypothetical protein